VLFETGYGPSGLPHIGTFGEVMRTTMVRRAFETPSDIPTRLICFSDDMDGMRKIPDNVPNPGCWCEHLHLPLTACPTRSARTRASATTTTPDAAAVPRHLRLRVRVRLGDRILPLRRASTPCCCAPPSATTRSWRSCWRACARSARRPIRCFLPIHPETGRVLYVPIKEVDGREGTVTFDDETAAAWTLPVTGGHVKLQWKPDFGDALGRARRRLRDVRQGPSTNGRSTTAICGILGGRAPEHYVYELFLDENGQKISKSKGNGLTIEEWLTYASPESLGHFMFQKPRTAKRLHFDVIPKAVDEYHQHLRAWPEQDDAQRLANPSGTSTAAIRRPSDMVVPFAMLLNLAVASAEDKAVLWGFIRRYAPEALARDPPRPRRCRRARGALLQRHREARAPLPRCPTRARRRRSRTCATGWRRGAARRMPEAMQAQVYAVGKAHGFDPLRDWFRRSTRCCSAPSRDRASAASSRYTGAETRSR
jgi:lysyl-tRNA synthetase, class I